jgi:hypothetical protein
LQRNGIQGDFIATFAKRASFSVTVVCPEQPPDHNDSHEIEWRHVKAGDNVIKFVKYGFVLILFPSDDIKSLFNNSPSNG